MQRELRREKRFRYNGETVTANAVMIPPDHVLVSRSNGYGLRTNCSGQDTKFLPNNCGQRSNYYGFGGNYSGLLFSVYVYKISAREFIELRVKIKKQSAKPNAGKKNTS